MLSIELTKAGLEQIFRLESELIPIVVRMECNGFAVDQERLKALETRAALERRELEASLRKKFGNRTLNLDSPDQLLKAFQAAGLALEDTRDSTLAMANHALVAPVRAYREKAKLLSTIESLTKHVTDYGRIHAEFNPLGTDTGRFACSNPNLQNVTRGQLRSCFVASGPDRKLVVADYSQIELRIAAYFAKDEKMLEAFRCREDLHRKTAAAILGKALNQVVTADRQVAKSANFGLLYGQSTAGFRVYSQTEFGVEMTLEQAARIRSAFFSEYKALALWHKEALAKAKTNQEARTILGRQLLPRSEQEWPRFNLWTAYRVSGSAADVLKNAMVKLTRVLTSQARLVATVHDELVFDVPASDAQELRGIIRLAMIDAFTELFADLPIEVETKVCNNWGEK